MKTKHFLLSLLAFTMACTSSTEQTTVEDGVSLELAQYRKRVISSINYMLEFRIPEAYDQPIQALQTMTFNLTDISQDILLDFRESADKLQFLMINGKSREIRFENEHLFLPAETLRRGVNTVEITFYTIR